MNIHTINNKISCACLTTQVRLSSLYWIRCVVTVGAANAAEAIAGCVSSLECSCICVCVLIEATRIDSKHVTFTFVCNNNECCVYCVYRGYGHTPYKGCTRKMPSLRRREREPKRI